MLVVVLSSPCLQSMTITSVVDSDSSVVECRTHNRESPDSNPLCYRSEAWGFLFSPRCPCSLSCMNEYLAIDSGVNVNE